MPTTHEESGLFNSGAWGDRYVTQVFWERLLNNMLHTGVVVNTGSEAQLTATSPPGMSCNISNFDAFIKGYYYSMTGDPKTLTFDAPGTEPRYDLIVLRLERESDREISLYVLKGTEASSPEYPALTRTDDDVYELALWACLIQPTDTTLDLTEATSLINDADYCGLFDLNYRGTAEGVLVPYSTKHTVYVPKWYNLTAPPSHTGYTDCAKWCAIDDDYIVGVNPTATCYFLMHERSTDTTTWDSVVLPGTFPATQLTYHCPLLLHEGKIYMWGFKLTLDGGTHGGRIAVYDIASGDFTYSEPCPLVYDASASQSCGIVMRGSTVYVFRNSTCYAWNTITDTWTLECSYTMQYDYNENTRLDHQKIFFVYDNTNDQMMAFGYTGGISCWTYDFGTATLQQHIDQKPFPVVDGIQDRITPVGLDWAISVANGDNGIIYFWCTVDGQRSSGTGVGAIHVQTGGIVGSIAYGYGVQRPQGYTSSGAPLAKLDTDGRMVGFSYITDAPGTLYHNKIGYRYSLLPLGTSTGNKICVVGKNDALNAFANLTQGVGDARGNVAIPLSAGDLYAINADYTIDSSNTDSDGTVQIEVIGAN